jgi:hypothetical protein
MDQFEKPMTRRYWERVRRTLLEEYRVGRRRINAVIVEDSNHRTASQEESVLNTIAKGFDIEIAVDEPL